MTGPGFDDLVARARALVGTGERRVLLGIAGSPGAGKSTLSVALAAALRPEPPDGLAVDDWVAYVPMDGFHLADVELERLGRRNRKGAPDTFDGHGYLALLRRLRASEKNIVYAPQFERDLEQPLAGAIPVPPTARLVITEGNYLLLDTEPWPAVAGELDEVWFCDLRAEIRQERLVARHIAFGKSPDLAVEWVRSVDEPNARRIETGRGRAHLVVPSVVLENLKVPDVG